MSHLQVGFTLMLCIGCLALAGCSSRLGHEELAVRQNAPLEAREHSLMIVTTRGRSKTQAALFSRERSTKIGYARALISVPSGRADEGPGQASSPLEDPQRQVTVRETDYFESEKAFLSKLDARARVLSDDNREVILFIHGYNTRFPEAVYRFAQFFHDLDQPAVPLLPGFHEVLRPFVVDALRYAFTTAQLSNAALTAQAIQDDPDLLFG